jgi:hypothetical protein
LSKLKRWRLLKILKSGSGILPVEEVAAPAKAESSPETTVEQDK